MEFNRGALQFREVWRIGEAIKNVDCAIRGYDGPSKYETIACWQSLRDYINVIEASLYAYIEEEAEHGERA